MIAYNLEAIMIAVAKYLSGALRCFVLLMSGLICVADVRADQDLDAARYHRAVEYCRGDVVRPMMLSPDGNILCMDGVIMALQTDPRYIEALPEGGLFVVRSAEGDGAMALAFSKLLLQRRATVIIYDYCLSACATFFFFASERTYVMKGALVAWQISRTGFPGCPLYRALTRRDFWTVTREFCDPLPLGFRDRYAQYYSEMEQFYLERSNSPESKVPPASPHISRYIGNMVKETGEFPDVLWTLNPANLNHFKTKIEYEAYPASQDELDEIVARLQLPRLRKRVIYDP